MSPPPTHLERSRERRRWLWSLTWFVGGLAALTLLDGVLFRALYVGDDGLDWLKKRDWYQLLRQVGYVPTWLIVGAAMALAGTPRVRRVGLLTAAAGALGGAAAEVLKVVLSRQRPINNGAGHGDYVWGPPFELLFDKHAGNHGLASSHAGVAFGACCLLAMAFPRAAPLFVALAAACGVGRMAAGAHFATDVFVAAGMSYALAAWLWGRFGPPLDWRGRA